ncbi:DUF4129 domain-containing protein [Nocardioides zeae]|uniref:DUF4129 domain-containing protein n=1 Tax=Nocardioides imazamoxiresistens TaxID=3231893 RepID=A0ABU3PYH5_9ACTN|nr:DUF4129 domain-containing protein [Nocardioides zeae]MDT9594302.1 DUF4129 domain-containing protein [Nocardioides zeae]
MRAEPPLEPTPGEARELLREELDHPAYTESDLLERIRSWLADLFEAGAEPASQASQLQTVLSMVALVLGVVAILWLLTRLRRDGSPAAGRRTLFGEEVVPAVELRRRAEQALAEGRHEAAVVDGYRALALRQIEGDQIDDLPGSTAREVAVQLAEAYGDRARDLHGVAQLFDAVLYGHRGASREQAEQVLRLDDGLPGGVRR